MGKKAVEVKDSAGFVSNRVLMLTINEAAYLVYEGVATAEEVDEVFRGAASATPWVRSRPADLIGVGHHPLRVEVLYEHYADSKYRPCPLLKQMADAGMHGRKTGRGFYTYGVEGDEGWLTTRPARSSTFIKGRFRRRRSTSRSGHLLARLHQLAVRHGTGDVRREDLRLHDRHR